MTQLIVTKNDCTPREQKNVWKASGKDKRFAAVEKQKKSLRRLKFDIYYFIYITDNKILAILTIYFIFTQFISQEDGLQVFFLL